MARQGKNGSERPEVRVFPDAYAPHLMQIHAGLRDLHAAARIRLRMTHRLSTPPRALAPFTLWVEITAPGLPPFPICFDMGDGPDILSMDGLERCGLYFKRSYSEKVVGQLPAGLGSRVVPYGLNYSCVGDSEWLAARNALALFGATLHGIKTEPPLGVFAMRRVLQYAVAPTPLGGTRLSTYLPARAFECPPDVPAPERVLFLTRVWETRKPDDFVERLNEQRAATVRLLRQALGDRFAGGLENTALARERYADCIAPQHTGKKPFLRELRRNLVAVTTTGLWDSIGWKLPEYLAASRCVVSEPPRSELPQPLQSGVHYLPFRTPDQCVAACDHLLTDRKAAAEMRHAAFRYYVEHVRPVALLGHCVERAVRACRDREAAAA